MPFKNLQKSWQIEVEKESNIVCGTTLTKVWSRSISEKCRNTNVMLLNGSKNSDMEQQEMGVAHFAFLPRLAKKTEELEEFIP